MSEKSNENQMISVSEDKSAFGNLTSFNNSMQIAETLSKSEIVPSSYQGKPENCIVALEMANRVGVSPLMVMQNLHIIKGKPSWSSQFIIAIINNCGKFTPLRWKFYGKTTEEMECMAYANDKITGEQLMGPRVSWKMAKAEGWTTKQGSKWVTMPQVMFQYRAAAFFGRMYCPEILQGMHSVEDIIDIPDDALKVNNINQEDKRILDWINNADTIEKLKQVQDQLTTDEQIDIYSDKLAELQNHDKNQ